MNYKEFITDVPNWPIEGVNFKDITPLLENREAFTQAIDELSVLSISMGDNIKIAGIESRGFIFGAGLAGLNGFGFIPVRKGGKLPPPNIAAEYEKEYGVDRLEVKEGSGDVVIVDDVLATGGSLEATEQLLTAAGYNVLGAIVLVDLKFLHEDILIGGNPVLSLVQYEE
jgi:adenine phosphoribosyltransferase